MHLPSLHSIFARYPATSSPPPPPVLPGQWDSLKQTLSDKLLLIESLTLFISEPATRLPFYFYFRNGDESPGRSATRCASCRYVPVIDRESSLSPPPPPPPLLPTPLRRKTPSTLFTRGKYGGTFYDRGKLNHRLGWNSILHCTSSILLTREDPEPGD